MSAASIPRCANAAVAEIVNVTRACERPFALLQRRLDRLPEPLASERDALARHQLTIEPGRSVMADLPVKAGGRQDADADVRPVPREIVGLAALTVGRDAPAIGVDSFDVAGPAQRLQPSDMGANEGLGITPNAVDGGSRPLQMHRGG